MKPLLWESWANGLYGRAAPASIDQSAAIKAVINDTKLGGSPAKRSFPALQGRSLE